MALTVSEVSTAPLTLTLFGPLRVLVQGEPLPRLRSRKAQWLLALLTLRHGRAVEREWLAGTLWPDMDQDQAFDNLRPVLSELRKALGGEGGRLQSPNRRCLCLDLTGAEVDVVAFDEAIASEKPSALERAVALYAGPLLEGCTEEWVAQERIAREQDCLTALHTLADAALSGSRSVAIGFYRRAVALDPWAEAARRGLMEALALGGDSNAALQVYREFLELLRDDPKAVPDEQTSALYARLRDEARRKASAPPPPPAAKEEAAPAVAGCLPHPLTGLVGREEERLEVAGRLRRSRLVTLTGPGGIGKTRLAVEVAREVLREYADGVWLVALDALSDGSRVPAQIAGALGLKEEAGRTALQSVTERLSRKKVLLVLDNCEHVLTACARAAEHLLRDCAGTRILATSRESLGIVGETAWAVPGLAVPDPAHLPSGRMTLVRVLSGYEGVQLFVERAQAVQKAFALTAENAPAVAQVCSRLEGIPLAIELAAARVRVMTAAQIAARLDDHLGLLTGSRWVGPGRHQTLRATLDWSYSLLIEPEQTLLARLSVFAGGWTLEAAEAVCAEDGVEAGQVLDLLTSLTDKSLVAFEERPETDGGTEGRYRLLEMVRQYAAARLEASGRTEHLRVRHRDYWLAVAEEAQPQLKGPQQRAWLQRLETEHDNLRAALAWCEAETRGAEIGLRLATALAWFWNVRGYLREGRERLRRALEREGAQAGMAVRANALKGAGDLAYNQSDYAAAWTLLEESLHIFRTLGDRRGIAQALNDLSNVAHAQGDYASARTLLEEGLDIFRTLDDKPGIALILGNLGGIVRQQGDYASARALLEESLSLRRASGDLRNVALTLNNLGNVVRLQGDYALAWGLYEEALSLRRELQDKQGHASSLSSLGALACAQGDHALAQTLLEESLSLRREMGNKTTMAWSLQNLGIVARAQGQWARAKALHEESLALFDGVEDKAGRAWSLVSLGLVAHHAGDGHSAQARLRESLSLFQHLCDTEGVAASLRGLATVLAPREAKQKAPRLWGAAQALRESIGAPLTPDEQREHERQVGEAATALGEAAFSAAWAEGHALTWEQAAAYALGESDGAPFCPGQ